MNTARFDVYGRYELDIERRDDRWIVSERGEGKRLFRLGMDLIVAGLEAKLTDLAVTSGG